MAMPLYNYILTCLMDLSTRDCEILASDGMLVKRPLLVTDSKAVPGFKEELWSEELL